MTFIIFFTWIDKYNTVMYYIYCFMTKSQNFKTISVKHCPVRYADIVPFYVFFDIIYSFVNYSYQR